MKLPQQLMALSTGELQEPRDFARFFHHLSLAFDGGLPAVLVREPKLSGADLLLLMDGVMELSAEYPGRWCGVHDNVHVAMATEAHGVHLGWQSMAPRVVRELVGDSMGIGFSTHEGDTSEDWEGADYLFHSPVFSTPSKQGILTPIGLPGLKAFAHGCPLPIFGLGGLQPEHGMDVMSTGCGIAVLSGILGAKDPGAATLSYMQNMGILS
jgi:thiamine-phosphate pyrophosphorylase